MAKRLQLDLRTVNFSSSEVCEGPAILGLRWTGKDFGSQQL